MIIKHFTTTKLFFPRMYIVNNSRTI